MLKYITIAMLAVFASVAHANETQLPYEVIIVTSERGKPTPDLEAAQTTEVVTRDDLDIQMPVDVTESIQRLPNVGRGPAGETLNFWQQGFTIRGLGSQRVLTLTDGVRISGQGAGYGGGNLSLYDLYSIERIELLKGPNSVLYGTDSFGGVINIITRKPTERKEAGSNGEIATEYNSAWGLERTGGYIDIGNEYVSAVFGGSYSENDNPKLADGTVADSGRAEKLSGFARVRFNLSRNKTLDLTANYSQDTDVLAADSEIDFGSFGKGPILIEFPRYSRSLVGATYTAENQGRYLKEYRLNINWQGIRREFDRTTPSLSVETVNVPMGPPNVIPRLDSVQVVTDDEIDTFEFSNQIRLEFGNNSLTAGIDLARDTAFSPELETRIPLFTVASQTTAPEAVFRNRVDSKQLRLGTYFSNRTTVNSSMDFVLSGRLDTFRVEDNQTLNKISETGYSGSASVIYYPNSVSSVYATVSSGFRIPDLSERYQQAVFNVVQPIQIIGNPDLDSERSYTAETGFKWRTGNWRGEAAVFFTQVEDYITTTAVNTAPRVEQTVNTGTAELWGWEAQTEYSFSVFSLYANAGRTLAPRSRDIVRVPGTTFNYGVRTDVWGFTVTLNGRTVLNSRDQTDLGRTTAAPELVNWNDFTVFDFSVTRDISLNDRTLFVTAGIRNLTDREYREPFFAFTQPERSLVVRAGIGF